MRWGLGASSPWWLSGLALACASQVIVATGPEARSVPEPETARAHAATTTSPEASPTPAPAAPPNEPFYSAEVLRLRATAQERILADGNIEDELGRTLPAPAKKASRPLAAENGNALGEFVPVENESALAHFHEQLERLATGRDADGKLRIAVYGASHTQGDFFTGYLRHYLQLRFGNGGQGFVQLAQVNRWYRTLDYRIESNGFKIQHAQRKKLEKEGWFGLLGAAGVAYSRHAKAKAFPKNSANVDLTASNYELFYFAQPDGGDFSLRVDEELLTVLSGKGPGEARYHSFKKPPGWHELVVVPKGNGKVRLFGASIERAESGIVVDTLGINGTRAANMLVWDEDLWREQIRRRSPELVLFAYGTNETVDTREPIATYQDNLRKVLQRFRRALPDASCLLMGPGDFPKEVGGAFEPRPRLVALIDVQRRVAPEFGCGFWDTYRFMGGEGSMARWVAALPRMGQRDHIHLSPRGYVKVGMALGDALMRAYDAFMLTPRQLGP